MFLEIDGSYGEGGGQILRSSLALSAILNQPIKISKIRAGRKRPGLAPQHLTGVNAIGEITDAKVSGAKIRSMELEFVPKTIRSGKYTFDVADIQPSAGSISLIFQTIAIPLAFAQNPSNVTLRGGTHVKWSPPVHYLQEIFLPQAARFGFHGGIRLKKWGWYPKGGGEAVAKIEPAKKFRPVELIERGKLLSISGVSASSNLPKHIVRRQKNRVYKNLRKLGCDVDMTELEGRSIGNGTLIFLKATFENTVAGFSSLGERGKRAEKVADEACKELMDFLKTDAAVGVYLADQLVLLMALAEGRSAITTSKITRHLLTNIWLAEQFLPVKFDVDGREGMPGQIATTN